MARRRRQDPAQDPTHRVFTAAMVAAMLYAVFALPGLLAAALVQMELGQVEMRLEWPMARLAALGAPLDWDTWAEVPLFELDLAAGLPVERSYAITPVQAALSSALAVLIGLAGARAIRTRRRDLALACAMGLPIALAPGALGHCVAGDQSGGLFVLLGASPDRATMLAAASPWLQSLYALGLVVLLNRQAGSDSHGLGEVAW